MKTYSATVHEEYSVRQLSVSDNLKDIERGIKSCHLKEGAYIEVEKNGSFFAHITDTKIFKLI
jgi:hypothetical protein